MNSFAPRIHVIFRVCDLVYSVRGASRPFNLSKRNLIRLCFYSLVESIKNYPHTIHILGDSLSNEIKSFFKLFDIKLHQFEAMGNDESIRQSFHLAKTFPIDDWVYFCEDDYLHVPHCFEWVKIFFEEKETALGYLPKSKWPYLLTGDLRKKNLYLHLTDYPDRYDKDRKHPSFIFQTSLGHWRQIHNTTFSFLTSTFTVKKKLKYLIKAARQANDYYLSKKLYGQRVFWTKGLCLSPMPSLATHMQNGAMSPIIDWEKIFYFWMKRYQSTGYGLE